MNATHTRGATNLSRAALHMVSAAFLFAAMGMTVKLASRGLPTSVVVFLRSALALAFLAPWLLRSGLGALKTRELRAHALRGFWGMCAMYCFFYTLAHLPLADALLINYSLPLFVPISERIWLGEPFPRRIWLPLAIGAVGLALVLKPGTSIFQPVALVGVAGAILGSVAQVGVRGLTRTEPVTRIVFYFSAVASAIALGPALIDWTAPPAALIPILLLMGASALSAQLLMTSAYRHAPASQVGPFIYSSVVFAALLDWLVLDRWPDRFALIGALFVAGAGVVALRLGRPSHAAGANPAPPLA